MIAILTTVGIVLSMLFETMHFFRSVSPLSFFFGTVWDPRFAAAGSGGSEGQFGLIPLLAERSTSPSWRLSSPFRSA